MLCFLFCTSGTVPEGLVLPIWHFWDCTRKCGVAYSVILRLYQKVWCCLFGPSGIVPEDVAFPIWHFCDTIGMFVLRIWQFCVCNRRFGVSYFVLLVLYQKVWFCLFCTSGTEPTGVVLTILYFCDCTRRCGVDYLALLGL